MKKSIFLSYPISNNELIRVKELLNNPKEEVEVYASKYDKYLIHATDINIIGIEEFDDREYDRPAFKIQLNNFIDDWLSYDAVGLFYSKKQNYYEGIRYSTVKELGTVLRMADALNCIIDSENITELYILQRSSELFSPSGSLTEGSLLENILKEICREKKIKYKYIYNRNLLVLRYRQMITIIAKNILKDTLSFFAWIINIYHLKKCYRNSKSKQIVFVGGARGFKKIIKTFDDRKIPTIHYRNKYLSRRMNNSTFIVGVTGSVIKVPIFTSLFEYLVGRSQWRRSKHLHKEFLWPAITNDCQEIILRYFKRKYTYDIIRIKNYFYTVESQLKKLKPSAVIIDNPSLQLEKIFLIVSNNLNIKSFEIQHGLINSHMTDRHLQPGMADKFIVWGNRAKNILNKKFAYTDNIKTLGSPRFDEYFTTEKKVANQNSVGIVGEVIDRHSTCQNVDYIERYYKIILNAALELSNITFSINLRNSDKVTYKIINNMIKNYYLKNISFHLGSNREWLQKMNCIITTYSTMGIEAMIYDIPVISIEGCLPNSKDIVGWGEYGAASTVSDTHNLIDAINESLWNPWTFSKQRKKYVSATLVNQGRASESIADYIINESFH